ncbi:MAG: protein kinase [Burkholderiales bacterium]|nr:protein kinase [Phycisphaerae bacterium]
MGQRISEYIIEEPLGAGTFGEVWRARHHVWNQQTVAIKLPNNAEFIRDLQREGLAVQGLEHPNIVRAIGFDPYADPPYLIMEYVPGSSLRQPLGKGAFAVTDAIAVMQQILTGLSHAHGRSLVHRDLKPENVLLHADVKSKGYAHPGAVKITDFGFGKRSTMNAGSIEYSMSANHERAKDIVGTLAYMSPEQRAGEDVDARSDLYACGIMLFEMITGEKPTGTEMPSDLSANVPAEVDEAFRRSYTRLDRRFASAIEMATVLGRVRAGGLSRTSIIPPLPKKRGAAACPRCQRGIGGKDQFCIHCGVQLVTTVRRCAHCGAYPDMDDEFCTQCGRTIARMRLAN